MSIQINSFLVWLLVGVSVISLTMVYQIKTDLETKEYVVCTK